MQVYNLGIDPATQRPSAEVHYDITKDGKTMVTGDRGTAKMANASQQIVLAERLTLELLEPGKYTVTIRVKDNVRKQTLTPSETFELR